VPCYVAIAPVIPQITDHELESIVEAAVAANARGGFFLPVRLPNEVAPLFRDWLRQHFPDRAGKVMSVIRQMRGGRDNDPNFFSRMRGQGPWADLLRKRFEKAAARYGLRQAKFALRTDLFEPPQGDQLRLL
jgi:DNA repair photolyase